MASGPTRPASPDDLVVAAAAGLLVDHALELG